MDFPEHFFQRGGYDGQVFDADLETVRLMRFGRLRVTTRSPQPPSTGAACHPAARVSAGGGVVTDFWDLDLVPGP